MSAVRLALERVNQYVEGHPCLDYNAKLLQDEQESYKELGFERHHQSAPPTTAAAAVTGGGGAKAIPRFYQPIKSAPLAAATASEEYDEEEEEERVQKEELMRCGTTLRLNMMGAAKSKEVTHRLRLLELWNGDVMKKLWEMLSEAVPRPNAPVDYHKFIAIAREFESWRKVFFEMEHSEIDYDALLKSARIPCAFHVTVLPLMDSVLFNACPHLGDRISSVGKLYETLVERMALFKSETELVMRDDDCDGCLNEEELRAYVEELVPTITVLQDMQEDLVPFYCCSSVRRLLWLLDTKGTGKVRISTLITHTVMNAWLDVQLAFNDPERNWFSQSIGTALHAKFVHFNVSGSGMITIDEMMRYKKGVPTVEDDGLPVNVSPLTEFFIERVFEVMPLFKGEMDYQGFIDFVLAVELLPQCPRPGFFWEIFDIHNEGYITPMVVNLFLRSVHQRLASAGVNPPAMELIVPEVFELIATKERLKITREEFFKSNQAGQFSSLLIDCLGFWMYENREQSMVQKHQQSASQEFGDEGDES